MLMKKNQIGLKKINMEMRKSNEQFSRSQRNNRQFTFNVL